MNQVHMMSNIMDACCSIRFYVDSINMAGGQLGVFPFLLADSFILKIFSILKIDSVVQQKCGLIVL